MSDEVIETPGPGLTIAQIKTKYEDPRFDLLRDETYMTDQHWAIFEMYMTDVIINAASTASREVIEQFWPEPIPRLALDVFMDTLRSEESVRFLVGNGVWS